MLKGLVAAASPLRIPLQALVVALAGVGAAWLVLNGHWPTAAAAMTGVILVGVVGNAVAARKALPGHPRLAVYLLQSWLLIPLAIAVVASAAAIVLAIDLALPKGTSAETEKLIGAFSTGLVAFLSGAFISWTGDSKDSQLADHVRMAFEAKYTRSGTPKQGAHVFRAGSRGELLVYANEVEQIEGWGWKARRVRAGGLAAELATRDTH